MTDYPHGSVRSTIWTTENEVWDAAHIKTAIEPWSTIYLMTTRQIWLTGVLLHHGTQRHLIIREELGQEP